MPPYFDQPRHLLSVPVFDPNQFNAVTLGDAQLQAQLLRSFMKEVPLLAEGLRHAQCADAETFADTVHRLRSSAHFVAGERLRHLLDRLEAAGTRGMKACDRSNACARIARELDDLHGILRCVIEALPAHLPLPHHAQAPHH